MNKEQRIELHKYLYKELAKVFETGTRQSRFDANNSEYHLPKIDLAIVPKIMEKIDQILKADRVECVNKILQDLQIRVDLHKVIKRPLNISEVEEAITNAKNLR